MDSVLVYILTATDAKPTGADRWMGHCRAHGSKRHRDLSIKLSDGRILLHCFGACALPAVCESLGLQVKDLFTDTPLPRGQRPAPKPVRVDRIALAFRFELAALDLRLRAERIFEAGKELHVAALSDDELDRAIGHTAKAHADIERAEVFEHVADTLRIRDFTERTAHERRPSAA